MYFSFELTKSGIAQISPYQSLLIAMIFVFHTICEGYYLCLVIGLSQIVANKSVIESEVEGYKDLQMKFDDCRSQSVNSSFTYLVDY